MKDRGVINLILPAVEIIQDHQPTDSLLQLMGTSTKELIEMFLNAWVEFKHMERMPSFGQDEMSQRANFELNARLLVMDIIFDAMERRVELGESVPVTEEDRRAAEKVMMSIWSSLSHYLFALLEEMCVSDLQISQLRFVRWLGDDFVVSIPRVFAAVINARNEGRKHESPSDQKHLE